MRFDINPIEIRHALRSETPINNTRDFRIDRTAVNLTAMRALGFQANRRLLAIETISQDFALADGGFKALTR